MAVLLNSNAKRVGPKVQEEFRGLVPAEDLFLSTSLEEAVAHATSIIRQRYDVVMVGGGDGTLTNTMNMLLRAAEAERSRRPLPDLGVLRLGTGNGIASLARSGKPAQDVARVLSGGRGSALPLRLIEDRKTGWVLPFCSMGYDAQVLNDYVAIVEGARSTLGRSLAKTLPGYFYALGMRTIPHELKGEQPRLRVVSTGRASIIDPETDEEVPVERGATLFEGPARAVLAATSPYYGFGMCVNPFARRRLDRFQLRVSTASIPYLLAHLPSLWKGTLRTEKIVDFLVEGVRIESSVPMPLQFAGDARGHVSELELGLSDRVFRLLEGTAG